MLNLDIWNILWTVVNILVLCVLIRLFLFRPVHKILAARKKEIDDDYQEAAADKSTAQNLKQEYELSMAQIKEEKHRILNDAQARASKEYEKIVEDAHIEANKTLRQAEISAQMEQEKMVRQAREQIADLVVAATAKIIGSGVGLGSDPELYDQFIEKTKGAV
ncbi:MAG: F0F1 ATP synthase subunit B [Clostridium sp.]|jgi:F-type H+-transporting ATPase subunit b|nr:F0F1 ATP synthase subunit B [Clostridium sp.]